MKNNPLEYQQNIIRCNNGFHFALISAFCWAMAYLLIDFFMSAYVITANNNAFAFSTIIIFLLLISIVAFTLTTLMLLYSKKLQELI